MVQEYLSVGRGNFQFSEAFMIGWDGLLCMGAGLLLTWEGTLTAGPFQGLYL